MINIIIITKLSRISVTCLSGSHLIGILYFVLAVSLNFTDKHKVKQTHIVYNIFCIHKKTFKTKRRDSKMTGLRMGQPGVQFPAEARDFSLTKTSRLALWPKQPFIQWVPGSFTVRKGFK
jgi:acid stress-induced BolA-like protein IbaG/YrbA